VRDRAEAETARLRAVDYSHVLERTVARLTAAKRYLDVVALFRKELDRNTGEEALYERFAEYLNQHASSTRMETYQQAIVRFNRPPGTTSCALVFTTEEAGRSLALQRSLWMCLCDRAGSYFGRGDAGAS
jgi:hypothetical protein